LVAPGPEHLFRDWIGLPLGPVDFLRGRDGSLLDPGGSECDQVGLPLGQDGWLPYRAGSPHDLSAHGHPCGRVDSNRALIDRIRDLRAKHSQVVRLSYSGCELRVCLPKDGGPRYSADCDFLRKWTVPSSCRKPGV
jgi:hypothetical protein